MDAVERLIEALSRPTYGDDYKAAKSNHTCILCRESATCFHKESARFEYEISAICEACQHLYFN